MYRRNANEPSDPIMAKAKICVFICSPYAGDTAGNMLKALRYMRFAAEMGAVPFAPHLLYPQVFDEFDSIERELGISFGLVWLNKCDELWVFGRHISSGMALEIAKANKRGIPIRTFTEACREVVE
jgi:hypothetical protein